MLCNLIQCNTKSKLVIQNKTMHMKHIALFEMFNRSTMSWENTLEHIKDTGALSVNVAKMIISLKMDDTELQNVIDATMNSFEELEHLLDNQMVRDIRQVEAIEKVIAEKDQVLSILKNQIGK